MYDIYHNSEFKLSQLVIETLSIRYVRRSKSEQFSENFCFFVETSIDDAEPLTSEIADIIWFQRFIIVEKFASNPDSHV